jgi:hypothetical protein
MANVWTETYEGSGHSNPNWDGPSTDSGCTYDPDATAPGSPPAYFDGSQCLEVINTGSNPTAENSAELAASESLIYINFSLYLDSHGIPAWDTQSIFTMWDSSWNDALIAGFYNNDGTLELYVTFYGTSNENVNVELDLDTYYNVEIKFDASGGTYEVWLAEGTGSPSSVESGSLPSGHVSNVFYFAIGLFWNSGACDLYLDRLLMDDASYIGVPSTGQAIDPTSISSAEDFGVTGVELNIDPASVTSGEAFGTLVVNLGGAAQTLEPVGIASGETFGLAGAKLNVDPASVASGEMFGAAIVILSGGAQMLEPAGIASAEAFGLPSVIQETWPTDPIRFITNTPLIIQGQDGAQLAGADQVYTWDGEAAAYGPQDSLARLVTHDADGQGTYELVFHVDGSVVWH